VLDATKCVPDPSRDMVSTMRQLQTDSLSPLLRGEG
jgi:hypothetical protein